MKCIEKIIGVKNPCGDDEYTPLTPYYINDYPGITIQTSANIADEKTVTGYEFLKTVIKDSMLRLEADILSYIYANYEVNSIARSNWGTGELNTPKSILPNGDANKQKGILIKKKKKNCLLEKLMISKINIYPNYTGLTTLRITETDLNTYKDIKVQLEADMNNEFTLNYSINGNSAMITLPANIPTYSTSINCGSGCGNTLISDCCEVNGIYATETNKNEGYGITADIQCKCDISTLVCDMSSDGLIARAAFELCGAVFYDMMQKTNRINYLTIYKSEEIKEQAIAGFEAYKGYLGNAMKGFKNYIVKKDGGCKCIDCSGIKIKANV